MQVLSKTEARSRVRALRRELTERENEALSAEIWSRLTKLADYKNAGTVFCYASYGKEVETHKGIRRMLSEGKRVFLPRVEGDGAMSAVEVTDFKSACAVNRYGITEPARNLPPADKTEIALCLLPGLAFDRKTLARVGYGKGYYDRFLAGLNVKKIGLCLERQLVDDMEVEDTDIPADAVVTECGLLLPDGGENENGRK